MPTGALFSGLVMRSLPSYRCLGTSSWYWPDSVEFRKNSGTGALKLSTTVCASGAVACVRDFSAMPAEIGFQCCSTL
ncbi:hypothetical protein D3C71_1366770 [compost metagenome]